MPAARAQFEQALCLGYQAAAIDLARVLTQPPAATSDVTHAVLLLQQAWRHGVIIAAFELGNLYERDTAGGPVAHAKAWSWYQRGADAAEPHALARYALREQQAAQLVHAPRERGRYQLAEFKLYAAATEQARREGWPDEAWRNWRLRRASLARLLALQGAMPEVARAYEHALQR
jgi:TPR repeat protein